MTSTKYPEGLDELVREVALKTFGEESSEDITLVRALFDALAERGYVLEKAKKRFTMPPQPEVTLADVKNALVSFVAEHGYAEEASRSELKGVVGTQYAAKWEPISTAPVDGTHIYVTRDTASCYEAWWSYGTWRWSGGFLDLVEEMADGPTLWRHIQD